MDAKQPQDEDASVAGRDPSGFVASRRRFTRAGLSGSVVLGSLVSKPVLGAVSPYCTVSGQASGNLSREALAVSCRVGQPPSYWTGANVVWPLVVSSGVPGSDWYVKGTASNNGCNFTGSKVRGTNFNGFTPGGGVPALKAAFYNVSGMGACNVVKTSTSNLATMYQVLLTTSADPDFELGRLVVASLLNARSLGNTYPVTEHTIIAMFNATFGSVGYFYPVDGSMAVMWDRARVIQYLSSLIATSA
jgi:hypothetical protein